MLFFYSGVLIKKNTVNLVNYIVKVIIVKIIIVCLVFDFGGLVV